MTKNTTIIVAALICGCVPIQPTTTGNPAVANDELVASLIEGETTKEEVVGVFGEPMGKDWSDGGLEKWVYVYGEYNPYGPTTSYQLTVVFEGDTVKHKGRGENVTPGP